MGEINNFDDFDFKNEKARWDYKSLKKSGIDFWTILLLKISPFRGIKRLSRKMGVNPDVADKAQELFVGTKRIDIVPLGPGSRGFQFIIDSSTSLYFYQDGDHFVYDGYEMGQYGKGEVTIFDNLDKK